MNIKEVSEEIHANNVEKGFWQDKETKNVGEVLCLVHSEISEALEAHRKGKFADLDAFRKSMEGFTAADSPVSFEHEFKRNIKDTFEDEIADTVIRLFDLCTGFGIDLETHIRLKTDYNKTRPYKHGKKY